MCLAPADATAQDLAIAAGHQAVAKYYHYKKRLKLNAQL
jgi:hypothetical protein